MLRLRVSVGAAKCVAQGELQGSLFVGSDKWP